jgi:hypothetical protein
MGTSLKEFRKASRDALEEDGAETTEGEDAPASSERDADA